MSGQPAGVTVLKRTVTGCLGSTGRFQLDQEGLKSDLNLMKRSLVYMHYTHHGYQTSIFGKNYAYYFRIFMVAYTSCHHL